MTLQFFLSWWNLIFVVPFALALLYLGLYTVSGITFGEADADAGGDLDADTDADVGGDAHIDGGIHAEGDAGGDGHGDGGGHADTDTDSDSDAHAAGSAGGPGPVMAALQWLGVGRAPVSIVLMVLLLTWGWFGFSANVLLRSRMAPAVVLAAVSICIAALGSIIVTRMVIGVVARWLPNVETNARRRHELLGSVGEAMYPIDEKFGMSSVRDTQGDLYQVPCQVGTGEPTVAKGGQIKLVGYNAKQGMFRVIPWGNGQM